MRHKALVAGLVGAFLLLVGFNPVGLPFVPEARFSDAAVSHWPAALHLRESVLARGEYPLWRETLMGGQPFTANPLNKMAYPLQALALLLEPAPFLNVMLALHLLLAGAGMWLWVRALSLGETAAAVSALAYVLAPKLVGHLGAGHVDVVYALAWWPWLMWAVHGLVNTGRAAPWAWVVRVGVLAGLVFLGDVRLSLFAFGLAGAYGLWEMARLRRWPRGLWFAPAGGIVVLLTLAVTVPLLAWRGYLNRGDLTPADAGLHSLEAGQLAGLVLPPHSGTPETLAYLGLVVLVLAGIGFFSAPRQHIFWLAVTLVAGLWALGVNAPLWPLLVSIFPGLLWFRVPARAWFVLMLTGALLAGYGLQALLMLTERIRREEQIQRLAARRLAVAGGMGAALFCGGFTLAVLVDLPGTIGAGVMLLGGLLGVVLLLMLYGKLTPSQLGVLVLLVLFVDLAWTGRNWAEWRAPESWLTHQDAVIAELRDRAAADDLTAFRVYSPNYALEQQAAAAHDLRLFYGVDPFQVKSVVEAMAQASGIPNVGYSVVQPPLAGIENDDALEQANCDVAIGAEQRGLLAAWGVRYIVSRCPLDAQLSEPLAVADGIYLYDNPEFLSEPNPAVTGWPVGYAPDAATIDDLHRLTSLSALVAGAAFVLSLVLLWVLRKYA